LLSIRFGTLQALSDVHFTISEGETCGFLGPNRAGKTTTIRILTGVSLPAGSTDQDLGRDIVKETIEARSQIGIVHETSNIYRDLTSWQNLMLRPTLRCAPEGTGGKGGGPP
jgi:ABC-2 type transport system ATP-binding protein